MSGKKKITINRRDRKLIRRPGGLIASSKEIEAIKRLKLKAPKATYKELSAQYFKRKGISKPERLKDDEGRFISKRAESEIKQAAKQLNISTEKARALFLERNKIMKVEIGRTMLHSVAPSIDALSERNSDLTIKIKLPGAKRYSVFKSVDRAKIAIEKYNKETFQHLRKLYGKLIPSDKLPTVKVAEGYRLGEIAADSIYIDLESGALAGDLSEEEYDELTENMMNTDEPTAKGNSRAESANHSASRGKKERGNRKAAKSNKKRLG